MQMTMRWFGPEEDKISLEHIRQVPGVEGVVGALYDVAVGEVWPVDKIERLVGQAHAAGLKMEVIESVNIHDDIKIGLPTRERYVVVKFFWTRRSDGRVMHRRATGRQGWPAFRTVRVIGSQVLNAIGYCYKS
ncbi:hypothetical protein SM22_02244 [Klebsiella pneumoniae]|nr:hypothetical protein SM19_03654 [Klebsiella pneumoniae]KMF22879.1 hypothetical protein SM22_02244 [Klebsiella pneumoniae]